MRKQSNLCRRWVKGTAVVAATAMSLAMATPATAAPLTGVKSATAENNVVTVTFEGDIQGRITLLEDGIFRYNIDPSVKDKFSPYAKPRDSKHVAKIQAQPDDSKKYTRPAANVAEHDGKFVITTDKGKTVIELDKATAKMSVKLDGKVVMEEAEPVDLGKSTVQKLVKHDGEDFFGGGTQNGRFIHTGKSINIKNESNWVDGGVASPNPFYWSSEGYGVLRNTFADGVYDFGKTEGSQAIATHAENELDAYYFVADAAKGESTAPIAQDLLQAYYKVTGNPVLLPEYAFYVGHLNAWNRDMWSAEAKPGYNNRWQIKGGTPAGEDGGLVQYEKGGTGVEMGKGAVVETLNGTGPTEQAENIPEGVAFSREFSARNRLDNYVDNDMPLGYFLPNDGYGAGYGQNGFKKTGGVDPKTGESSKERLDAVKANVENLRQFTEYANGKGVATGLWTQSYLTPDSNPATEWQLLRDFSAEVKTGGVTTLKTDVAWVGPGYSMALDGTKTAYDIVTEQAKTRPNIITLDGWAGTQRFGAIWTGDQTGGNWEYIRFHVPTFIGQSLSGNPNIGSDNDGIFGGQPIIATRDYQWKSFAPLMLDMDGWGSYVKAPQTHGDPYTGISRMYLKLKSQLMPYIYTTAASAANIDTGNNDAGMPFVRAILLSDDSAYAASTATQYEYTMGEDFLVAPVYQNTDGSEDNKGIGDGDDVRNGIYLPGTSKDIWIDYFTGTQYRGGQVLNNFEAPLWKLPLFVKANAIVPMYEPNNSPDKVDRSIRNVEFFAIEGKNDYTLFEDTGTYIENNIDESNTEYGREGNIDYGGNVKTKFTSDAAGDTATFTAEKSTGDYTGYKKDRTTTFIVNVSAKPKSIVAKNGDQELKQVEVKSQAEFDAAKPEAGQVVYFYNEAPNLNYNATAKSEQVRKEGFSSQKVTTTPKLYVKFAKTDVKANAQQLVVKGFANDGKLPADQLNKKIVAPKLNEPGEDDLTPTSVNLTWNKVEGAIGYDILIDDMVNAIPSGETASFVVADLPYNSEHSFKVRTRTAEGYSDWSNEVTATTLEDPWRNAPKPVDVKWDGGEKWGKLSNAFDHDDQSSNMFHSTDPVVGKPMTIDYGKNYKLDKFIYTPRQDNGGNGNVSKMKVETSLDGAHWVEHPVEKWDNSGAGKMKAKTVELDGVTARYLRLTVQESAGGFFSATELALYKADGDEGQQTGSLKAPATVGSEDEQHIGNCVGRENHGTGKADWESHVVQSSADFNLNGAYDVYDMSFTMSALDGGTKKDAKVSGTVGVIPEKTSVKEGETISVSVKANDAKNVNAMGALVHYPSADFSFVAGSLKVTDGAKAMENRSGNFSFGDETDSVNIALANKGDKDLYSGTGDIATFQLKAKRACEVNLDAEAWLIGPKQDFVSSKEVDLGPEIKELGQDAFKITMTNDVLTKDDGTNVGKLIQQNSYNGLFDGDEGANGFEFKWDIDGNHKDGKLPDYVKLPTTIGFELLEPRALQDVQIVNRDTYNGTVTSMEAVITYADGTKSEFKGGEFAKKQAVYTLTAEKGKKVQRVEIKPLTSEGVVKGYEGDAAKNRMLTLREINFRYAEGEVAPPVEEVKELAQADFNIKLTNEGYPVDDGENVKKLVQQNSYDGLFNGDNNDRAFEFKWFIDAATFDEKVGLPANISFELKQPRTLKNVELFNGNKDANGSINKLEAVITFTDGSAQEFKGGDFDANQPTYLFEVSEANKDKKVAKVEIKPMESTGEAKGLKNPKNHLLTIGEINFNYVDGGEEPEVPQVNKAELQAKYDEVKGFKAEDYTAESWQPFAAARDEAAKVLANEKATQDEVNAALAKLTEAAGGLKAPAPKPQVDKAALEELYNSLKDKANDGYTDGTWGAFQAALEGAGKVLANEKATQDEVNAALKALTDADAGLVKAEKPVDPDKPVNPDKPAKPGQGGEQGAAKPNGKPGTEGNLAQTGDPAMAAAAATGLGGVAAAIGAFLRRRRS